MAHNFSKRILITSIVLTLAMLFFDCNQKMKNQDLKYGKSLTTDTIPKYHFAVYPLHKQEILHKLYLPLIDFLNRNLKGVRLTLEVSREYNIFEQKYKNRKSEFILVNPWQTLEAMKAGYTVIAMAGEPEDLKGIFIVRKDSNINKPSDLIGKVVCYPAPTAFAACIMPQYFLYGYGININKDIKNRYVGSQESSIMNVYMKITSAGTTRPTPWRLFIKNHPKEAAELKVIWETEPLINNSVMVRNDIPAPIKEQVQKYLLGLDKTTEGKKFLKEWKPRDSCPLRTKTMTL